MTESSVAAGKSGVCLEEHQRASTKAKAELAMAVCSATILASEVKTGAFHAGFYR